ncbi:MAG: sugar-binding protein [Phycisphaeraceae bacterium]
MTGFLPSYRLIPAVIVLMLPGCVNAFSQTETAPETAPEVATPALSQTRFLSDGTVIRGQTRLVMRRQGTIDVIDEEGEVYTLFLSLGYKDAPKIWRTASHLENMKIKVDPQTQSVLLTGKAVSPSGATDPASAGEIQWGYALTPQGVVRCTLKFVGEQAMSDVFQGVSVVMSTHRKAMEGEQLLVDQEKFLIDAAPPSNEDVKTLKSGKIGQVIWDAGHADRKITVRPIQCRRVDVKTRNQINARNMVELFFLPADKQIVLDIQLPANSPQDVSVDTYGGIDYWAADRLRMPRYDKCRNLVQNPGFDAGFQYWRWNSMGVAKLDTKYDQQYAIVDDPTSPGGFPGVPGAGGRCLALRGEVGQAYEQVSTFGIPTEPDQTYTLSFYAKADKPGQYLGYTTVTGVWGAFPAGGSVKLTDQWQRFTKTFKAPNRIVSLGFGNHKPTEECWMYVTAVQIEKGDAATEYVQKPVGVFLESDARGNYWQPGTNPHARLRIHGKPAAKGQVSIIQEDFFGRQIDRDSQYYTLDDKGRATMPLPWAADLKSGIYVHRVNIQTDDGFTDREYVRMTVLPFQDGSAKNKNIFSLGLFDSRCGDWDRRIEFLQRMGIGSGITFDPQPHKYYESLRKHNILYFVSIFDGGEGFFADPNDPRRNDPSLAGLTPEQRKKIEERFDIFNQRKTCHLTDEQLKQVEERAYQKAAAYPEVQYWKLNNEPPVQFYIDNVKDTGAMARVLRAARRGLLRANPRAKVISPDPSNMYPNSGIAFINTLLEVSAGDPPFDIAAIHPYRAKPEEPDRDRDAGAFLNMLDRNKFRGDAWFTEGIYHNPYNIPLLDLNVHHGCTSDHYRGGDLSYAMGWGERMAAAYTARSWLVSLKYSDRVKLDVDWGFLRYSHSDIDLTPRPVVFAANTLVRVLGNATFKRDLVLAANIRCYVFQNEKNQPVAAIWAADDEVDRGRSPGPMLDVGTLATALPASQVIDFMGGGAAMPAKLRVGPFPQFIVGPVASMDSFLDQLALAVSDSGGELFPYLALRSVDQVHLVIANSLGRPFRGRATIMRQTERLAEADLDIAPRGQWAWILTQPLTDNQVNATDLTLKVVSEGVRDQSFNLTGTWMKWPKRKNPIVLDGDLSDWAGCFRMPLVNQMQFTLGATDKLRSQYPVPPAWKGADDLSAEFHAAWDEQNLYLAFKVRDDVYRPGPSVPLSWQGDGLQLYLDGWADARGKPAKGYDNNDQAFMVCPNPAADAAVLYREFAPERQLAFLNTGMVNAAKVAVHKTDDGYLIYELAIPAREVEPVKLKALEKFGFGCLVNDADNDYRKRILTITPPGTEPSRSPKLYPTVILTP